MNRKEALLMSEVMAAWARGETIQIRVKSCGEGFCDDWVNSAPINEKSLMEFDFKNIQYRMPKAEPVELYVVRQVGNRHGFIFATTSREKAELELAKETSLWDKEIEIVTYKEVERD